MWQVKVLAKKKEIYKSFVLNMEMFHGQDMKKALTIPIENCEEELDHIAGKWEWVRAKDRYCL